MFRQIVASLALATLASASTPPNKARDGPGPNPIHARLAGHREGPVAESWHKWRKRQTAAGLQNQQTGTAYTIDLEIGTPPQNITVMVDTGSVNLWVNPDCANYDQESYCDGFAQFDYTQSSTIEDTGIEDDLAYGKGEVVVQYVTDVVSIGSASITAQQFGIALESTDIGFGLLGLSPPLDGNEEYSYVLDSMVDQGLIESRAFSLDLRDIDSPDGALIFGGVDTGKFIGSLTKCPILDASETPSGMDRYWINMNYIGMTDSDGNSGLLASGELAVFLDSGGTLTRLPTSVFNLIGDAFAPLGAEYDDDQGVYIVDCDLAKESGSIDFGFGDQVIGVSFKNFIWPLSDKNTCILGIQADDDQPVLGDSFLRAAYVVYDQDNSNIHLAQAAECGSNLVAISSGEDAVPSSSGDCTGATATAATSTLNVGTAATATTDVGSLQSVGGPGPEGTGGATSSGTFCLTCSQTGHTKSATKTGDAGAKTTHHIGAAAGRGEGSPLAAAAVGVAAVAAWLV